MIRRFVMSCFNVIIRRGRTVSPGHHLLHNFHFVLFDDLNPLFIVRIRRPALVLLMFFSFLLLLMFLVLLLGRGLFLGITSRILIRTGTDVLFLVFPATAATFLALPAAPPHLHVLRAGAVRRFRGIRRARAGTTFVLFLRLAHPACRRTGINNPSLKFQQNPKLRLVSFPVTIILAPGNPDCDRN